MPFNNNIVMRHRNDLFNGIMNTYLHNLILIMNATISKFNLVCMDTDTSKLPLNI